jgi:hypothetical protein
MSPKSRTTPTRPPVRSKTALPAPRVAPKRIRVPWHQRRPVQVILALIVLGLLVLAVTHAWSAWDHHQATMKAKKGVKAFDAAYQTDLTPLSNFFTQVNNSPQQYVGGIMSQATYATQTAQWLATFETLRKQLSGANPPKVIQGARGLLVQSTDIFIDGVKEMQLAGTVSDPKLRQTLVDQGRNVIFHGTSVFKNAQIEEAKVVKSFHLTIGAPASALLQLPDAPPENAPPAPSPTPVPSPS